MKKYEKWKYEKTKLFESNCSYIYNAVGLKLRA